MFLSLFAYVLAFCLPLLFWYLFFPLLIPDFLSFIIDSLWLCAWPMERKAHYLFHRPLYHSGAKCRHEE